MEAQRLLESSDAELKRVYAEAHAESARLIEKYGAMEKRLTQDSKDTAERLLKESERKLAQERAAAAQTGTSAEDKIATIQKQHAADMDRLNKELATKQEAAQKERDAGVATRNDLLATMRTEHSKVENQLRRLGREDNESKGGDRRNGEDV